MIDWRDIITMNVLICFPSKGKSREDIEFLRTTVSRKAIRSLKSAETEVNVLDPFLLPSAPIEGQKDDVSFVSDLVHMLLDTDVVYLAKNWSTDRYCKVLFNICQQYGIRYVSE